MDDRDLHALGWWLIEQVLDGESGVAREQVAIAATLMRVLAALGPASADSASAARETELRARLLHGLRLRDEEDWRLAHSLFDDATIEVLSALATGSGEGDGGNRGQPLRRIKAGADEVDLARVSEDKE